MFAYFKQDEKKDGGAYTEAVGIVKKIDQLAQHIVLIDGTIIPMDDILDVEAISSSL